MRKMVYMPWTSTWSYTPLLSKQMLVWWQVGNQRNSSTYPPKTNTPKCIIMSKLD
jgi:hypothetical protein